NGGNSSGGGAGGSTGGSGGTGGLGPRCMAGFSGAISAPGGGAPAAGLDQKNRGTLQTMGGGGPGVEILFMSVQISGPPQARSYDATSVIAAQASTFQGNMSWFQQTGSTAKGSFSIDLTSITTELENTTNAYYLLRGTWNATLPAA